MKKTRLIKLKPRLSLPDAHPVLRRKIQLFSGLHVKCRIPCVNIADRGGAILAGSMRVGHDLAAHGCVADFGAPVLPEGNKELLIASETVLRGRWFAAERCPVAIVSRGY